MASQLFISSGNSLLDADDSEMLAETPLDHCWNISSTLDGNGSRRYRPDYHYYKKAG
jgi:hypothetical protein